METTAAPARLAAQGPAYVMSDSPIAMPHQDASFPPTTIPAIAAVAGSPAASLKPVSMVPACKGPGISARSTFPQIGPHRFDLWAVGVIVHVHFCDGNDLGTAVEPHEKLHFECNPTLT